MDRLERLLESPELKLWMINCWETVMRLIPGGYCHTNDCFMRLNGSMRVMYWLALNVWWILSFQIKEIHNSIHGCDDAGHCSCWTTDGTIHMCILSVLGSHCEWLNVARDSGGLWILIHRMGIYAYLLLFYPLSSTWDDELICSECARSLSKTAKHHLQTNVGRLIFLCRMFWWKIKPGRVENFCPQLSHLCILTFETALWNDCILLGINRRLAF